MMFVKLLNDMIDQLRYRFRFASVSFVMLSGMVELTSSIPASPLAEMNDFVLGLTVGRLALDLAVRLGTNVEKRYHRLYCVAFILMQKLAAVFTYSSWRWSRHSTAYVSHLCMYIIPHVPRTTPESLLSNLATCHEGSQVCKSRRYVTLSLVINNC